MDILTPGEIEREIENAVDEAFKEDALLENWVRNRGKWHLLIPIIIKTYLLKLSSIPDEEMVGEWAKTCYQYAYLIDDKKIDGIWAGLSDRQSARFYDCASQLLSQAHQK